MKSAILNNNLVPKIKRHKYLKDERKYSLVSDFDSGNPEIFAASRLDNLIICIITLL